MISRLAKRNYTSQPSSSKNIAFKIIGAAIIGYTGVLVAVSQTDSLKPLWNENVFYGIEQLEFAEKTVKNVKAFDFADTVEKTSATVTSSLNKTREFVESSSKSVKEATTNVVKKASNAQESLSEKYQTGKEHSAALVARFQAATTSVSSTFNDLIEYIKDVNAKLNGDIVTNHLSTTYQRARIESPQTL